MTVSLPDEVKKLLDEPVFVHVATVNPDGSPHASVVWVLRDGDRIRFSTAEGRVKARNLRHNDQVSLSFTAPSDPYRAVTIQGRVVDLANDGRGLIDRLAQKYLSRERYPWMQPGEERLDVTVEPVSVAA